MPKAVKLIINTNRAATRKHTILKFSELLFILLYFKINSNSENFKTLEGLSLPQASPLCYRPD